MKTWRKTVITVEQIGGIMQPCVSPTAQGVILAQEQAEISWNARDPEIAEARKAGMQEVVEMMNQESSLWDNPFAEVVRVINEQRWQAKCKELETRHYKKS